MPVDPRIAEALPMFGRQAVHVGHDDYIFAGDGGKPRWQATMLADHVKPAAVRTGIGNVGWHMFRHMLSSMLHQAGAKMAVQKELLRHADIQTTMNIYTQAISAAKREAVHRVAELLLNG